jgi:iron-sulfur cluster insertion protein
MQRKKMITLTTKAVTKIKEIAESDAIETLTLRVKVLGGGCAGFSYDLYFEDNITDMDEVFEKDDVKIAVDMLSHQYLDGVEIDYVEGVMGAGFKFLNPNVKSTCGCGSSVEF